LPTSPRPATRDPRATGSIGPLWARLIQIASSRPAIMLRATSPSPAAHAAAPRSANFRPRRHRTGYR
jgi:hypothetical protein